MDYEKLSKTVQSIKLTDNLETREENQFSKQLSFAGATAWLEDNVETREENNSTKQLSFAGATAWLEDNVGSASGVEIIENRSSDILEKSNTGYLLTQEQKKSINEVIGKKSDGTTLEDEIDALITALNELDIRSACTADEELLANAEDSNEMHNDEDDVSTTAVYGTESNGNDGVLATSSPIRACDGRIAEAMTPFPLDVSQVNPAVRPKKTLFVAPPPPPDEDNDLKVAELELSKLLTEMTEKEPVKMTEAKQQAL